MGERLGQGEAQLVVCQIMGKGPASYVERCSQSAVENRLHSIEPFFVVDQDLAHAPIQVVEEGAVAGQDQVRTQPS